MSPLGKGSGVKQGYWTILSCGSPFLFRYVRSFASFPLDRCFPYPTLDYVCVPPPYGGKLLWKGYGGSSGIISRLDTYPRELDREPDKHTVVADHLGGWDCANLLRLVHHPAADTWASIIEH